VFSMWSVTRCYKQDKLGAAVGPLVVADLNISTVALRLVGGDESKSSVWGYIWATLFLVDINRGLGAPVKYGHESRGTRTQE
jgi:hypothetical protein